MKYVTRDKDGRIALVMDELLPGYALAPAAGDLPAEALDDDDAALLAEIDARANPVPRVVTPYQLRVALRSIGKLEAVEAWIAGQAPDVRDAWAYGQKRPIDHPVIVACATACGLDLPSIFRAAEQVR